MNREFTFDKFGAEHKQDFLDMSREFYASDAVLSPVPDDFHLRALDELLKSDRYIQCYIFRKDNETAGYALLAKSYSREAGGEMLWIDEIYIRPSFRGMGAAKMFFDFIHTEFSPARFRLEVEKDNARAIALYEKKGYSALPYVQMIRDNKQ